MSCGLADSNPLLELYGPLLFNWNATMKQDLQYTVRAWSQLLRIARMESVSFEVLLTP